MGHDVDRPFCLTWGDHNSESLFIHFAWFSRRPGLGSATDAHGPCPILFHSFKRVIAAWRVLVGVWAPKRWDLSLVALSQYTTPLIAQESRWVDRSGRSCTPVELPVVPLQQAQKTTEPPAPVVVVPTKKRKRPEARRIMRHVLRALASFFGALEAAGEGKCVVCVHLARRFRWVVDSGDDRSKWRRRP